MNHRAPEPLPGLKPTLHFQRRTGFTLLELLVVIVIIGLLAAVGLPAIRGMTKSNSTIAADRQLLDDIAYARQRAIADHTTVYMVFVPPTIVNMSANLSVAAANNQTNVLTQFTNLFGGQYTTYALLSLRSVGDQPGQPTPHYLTGWRSLPNGVFIATNKFARYDAANTNDYTRAFPSYPNLFFPFPIVAPKANVAGLPYIGFDYLGRLISTNNQSEAIPLARGSIFYARDANGAYVPGQPADVLETPLANSTSTSSNVIHIDWLTGKAHVERLEVQ